MKVYKGNRALFTLTELFKLFMLTLDSGEKVFSTQLILVGKRRQVEPVILCKLLVELCLLLSDRSLSLGDLLFEFRQLVSDRSRSHIITTILNFSRAEFLSPTLNIAHFRGESLFAVRMKPRAP